MDSEKSTLTIEKLHDGNFHVWKMRIRMVLSIRELDEHLDTDTPSTGNIESHRLWKNKDKKARALIGMSISDDHLEQVQHAESAKEMFGLICDMYEKHTLLNKLAARRRFYTATMKESEKVLSFSARVRQYATSLKSMGVAIDDQEMAMAFLCGLPDKFDGLISALDALADDKEKFGFKFVVSRCQQEEQRHSNRLQETLERAETAALVASRPRKPTGNCVHCGRHDNSEKCWKKFPHLAPENRRHRKKNTALLASSSDENPTSDDNNNFVCLLGSIQEQDTHYCLNSNLQKLNPSIGPEKWIIDSGSSAHLTYDRSAFTSYSAIEPKPVDLGANSSAFIIGEGDVTLTIFVRGKNVKCIIKNVKHVPELRYQLLSVSVMAKQGISTIFDEFSASLVSKNGHNLIAEGKLNTSGLYVIHSMPDTTLSHSDTALVADINEITLSSE